MRKGAIFDQLPSGACEIKALYLGTGCHFSSNGESQKMLTERRFPTGMWIVCSVVEQFCISLQGLQSNSYQPPEGMR
jgi:hypothetical protein